MSSLPERGEKENYTASEVDHIVARRMAEQQIIQLQNGQLATNQRLVDMGSQLSAKLDGIFAALEKQPEKLEKHKVSIMLEVEKDFPSKIELMRMEGHIKTQFDAVNKKVDIQWVKITLVLSTITAVIVAIGGFINYLILVEKLIGK